MPIFELKPVMFILGVVFVATGLFGPALFGNSPKQAEQWQQKHG